VVDAHTDGPMAATSSVRREPIVGPQGQSGRPRCPYSRSAVACRFGADGDRGIAAAGKRRPPCPISRN
jgi:hypothetical protein